MSKATIQPTKIKQPLAGKRIKNSSGNNIKSPSVCVDGNADPAYHPWEYKTLDNFLTGKKIQCGRKSSYFCNLSTVNWIKGYRNTCPIAGCCGTFNRPAPLELTDFNFKSKKITKKLKINRITMSYKHHVTGVDVGVGSGSETKNWAGVFPYVNLILYRVNAKGNETKISTVKHDTRVPLAKNATVKAVFEKNINNFNPAKEDLKIEINYAGNGGGSYSNTATNPSILYLDDLSIQMDYDYIEEPKIIPPQPAPVSSISGTTTGNTIITDARNPQSAVGASDNCRTSISHTIYFKNTKASDIVVTVPNGVTYSKTPHDDNVVYTYQDASGVEGEKSITYVLSSDKTKKVVQKYTAKLYQKPTISLLKTNYIKNQKYRNDTFIKVTGRCWNTIDIYKDGNQKKILHCINNNIDNAKQEEFLGQINQLSCGNHVLHFYVDNKFSVKIPITIKAPNITFTSTLKAGYNQNKSHNEFITITRTDNSDLNQPISVNIVDTANKLQTSTVKLYPKQSFTQELNLHYPGKFEVKYQYSDGCTSHSKSFGKYNVYPTHKQSYDHLLIRTDNAPIEYQSIVVRQGDNQRYPTTYTHATLVNNMNDFVLFGGDGLCNIGELGYGTLAIKNPNDFTIKNLCIELNPLYLSENEDDEFDDLTTEWTTGMLQNFEDNFFIANPTLKNVVKFFNKQYPELIDDEFVNVILQITEIQPNQLLPIKIPYASSYEKEIFMNFLLLGEPSDFIDIDAFMSADAAYEQYESYNDYEQSDNKYASNTSKMENRGCMCISLRTEDLRPTELYIEGDDLDRNDILSGNPNLEDLDILYRIKIPESECDDNTGQYIPLDTKIVNDYRLIPTKYRIGNTIKDINFEDNQFNDGTINAYRGMKIDTKNFSGQDVFLRYRDNNSNIKYIRAQTDKNGIAQFKYIIPSYQDTSSNINEEAQIEYRLEEILNTVDIFYKGDDIYKPISLSANVINPLTATKIDFLGFIYYLQDDNNPYFIDSISLTNIDNISTLYVVGRLYNQENNVGLNDEIITVEGVLNAENEPHKIMQKGFSGIRITNPEADVLKQDGLFKIRIPFPRQYLNDLQEIRKSLYISYQGDFTYQSSFYCNYIEENEIANNRIQVPKYNTYLKVKPDYNIYRRGETITIRVHLEADIENFVNTIDINFPYNEHPCYKNIHIYYQTCSNINIEGFKTIFKTNNPKLLPNQTEAYIYCNVDTDLQILARLQKKVVENHNVNVLTINALNGYKPNKNVIVKAFIGPNTIKKRLGDYLALTAIDIDKEKYSYDQSSDIIYWEIGDMDSYETQKCNILLEAEEIGNNTIYVCKFDYLHLDEPSEINTTLVLTLDGDYSVDDYYYIDDIIPLKAVLTSQKTNENIYGEIEFDKQVYDESSNQYIDTVSESISQVSTFNNQHFARAYTRFKEPAKTQIKATYNGAEILSNTYNASESNILEFPNVSKYDTTVELFSNQDTFYTNQNIHIGAMVSYNRRKLEENNEVSITKTKYFDESLNIKIFIENQELTNISYDDNTYNVNFIITQAGTYTIRAFIPNTRKTEEHYAEKIINVIDGE